MNELLRRLLRPAVVLESSCPLRIGRIDGRIDPADLQGAPARQGVALAPGDAVFIRTGRMAMIDDSDRYLPSELGIGMDATRWLVEVQRAMLLGSDIAFIGRGDQAARRQRCPHASDRDPGVS